MLDAEAEVYILLVAGVGVEVVGGATVELVTLTHLAANEEAEGYGAQAGGDPAYGLDEGRFVVFHLVLVGKREWGGGRNNLGLGTEIARVGAELHGMDDTAG